MFDVIKILFVFIVFIFLCETFGLFILSKFNIKLNIIAIPIGMALFSSVYELLILPIQYFNLDSIYLKLFLIVSAILLGFLSRNYFKEVFNKVTKRDILLITIFIIVAVFKMLDLDIYKINQETGDNLFYIPFVNGVSFDGVSVNGVGTILNIIEANNNSHAFYGQIHFLSALSNILNVDPVLSVNFFQTWYVIVFQITNIFNICYICIHYQLLNNINKIIIILFISLYFLPAVSTCEVLCVEITSMTFVVAPLIFYLKDKNKNWLYVFCMYSVQAISFRSSYIFVIALFLLPYYLYLLINDRFEVKENVLIVMPILLFLVTYLSYYDSIFVLLIRLVTVVLIYVLVPLIVRKIGNKKTRIIYFIFLIVLFAMFVVKSSQLGNFPSTWNGVSVYDEVNSFYFDFTTAKDRLSSILNISFLVLGILSIIGNLIRKTEQSYIGIHIVSFFVLFLNILVAPYISSFLTEVYSRSLWAWINPLFYLMAINDVLDLFKDGVIRKFAMGFVVVLLLLQNMIYYSANYYNYCKRVYSNFLNNKESISFYYKVGEDSYQIGKAISNYAEQVNKKYLLVDMPLNVVNSSFVSNKIRLSKNMGSYGSINNFVSRDYFTQQWNEDKYQYPMYFYLLEPERFFGDWMFENAPQKIPQLKELFNQNNVDVFVIKKPIDVEETFYHFEEHLDSFSSMLFENETYAVYAVD